MSGVLQESPPASPAIEPIPTEENKVAARQAALRRLQTSPRDGLRVGLASIPKTMSQHEALQEKQHYTPPDLVIGETVLYRRTGGGDERLAIIVKVMNKAFTIKCLPTKSGLCEDIMSCSYYDETGKPEDNDPYAAHNNNGCIRRTPFGQRIYEFMELLKQVEKNKKGK